MRRFTTRQDRPPDGPFGTLSLTCLVVANMIGVGVYTTSGFSLAELHDRKWVLACWCVAGGIAILGALCYGGLAKILTQSGGEYLFLARSLHPLAGFMAGWISLTAGFSGSIALSAKTFEAYLPNAFGDATWHLPGITMVIVFTLVNLLDLRVATRFQNALVLGKLAILIAFILYGLSHIVGSSPLTHSASSSPDWTWNDMASSIMWISYSYAGYNAAIYVAGSTRDGERTVPRSMVWATAIVTLLYLALNGVLLYATPSDAIQGKAQIALIVAANLEPAWIAEAVRTLVLVSLATSVMAMIQIGPHVYAKMASDRLLPSFLAPSRSATPRLGVLLQSGLAILLITATSFQELLEYLGFLLSISSAATASCLFLRQFRGNPGQRPVLFWPWVPLLFIVATLTIAGLALQYRLRVDPKGLLLALSVLPVGMVVYLVMVLKSTWLTEDG